MENGFPGRPSKNRKCENGEGRGEREGLGEITLHAVLRANAADQRLDAPHTSHHLDFSDDTNLELHVMI